MGKWLSGIAVVLLLVVVPFGSWYYLKSGLTYRRNGLAEVKAKDSIPEALDSLRLLKGKISVLVLSGDTATRSVAAALMKQFEKVPSFQILFRDSLAENERYRTLPASYMRSLIDRYDGYTYMLVDTAYHIRNTYKADKSEIQKLVEHIAIVLPRQKDPDIQMKEASK